jgi:branched-chain amino acid transport system substrate-binding protein
MGTVRAVLLAALLVLVANVVPAAGRARAAGPIVLGALYPLRLGSPPVEEYHGLQTAVQMVDAAGGIHGRMVRLSLDSVARQVDIPAAVHSLVEQHVTAIVGASESAFALPASEIAQQAGTIYWESGAVATMLTTPGHPDVFRTVTTSQTLGRAAADYAARTIAPRLHLGVHQMRVAVVSVRDVYGLSVAAAQVAETRELGMKLVTWQQYYEHGWNFVPIVRALKAARPNVVLVAAYIPDAIAFRRETLRQHLRVGAMIGTSSSFCMSAFGDTLGRGAVGLFASDKPDINISPRALTPAANRLRLRANALYRARYGADMTSAAVAGFVAGWVLLHNILPRAASLTPAGIRQAALAVNLPYGSEINGSGVRFAGPHEPDQGQNLRAISVIWQWQKPGKAAVVYPPLFATSTPRFVPLPTNL